MEIKTDNAILGQASRVNSIAFDNVIMNYADNKFTDPRNPREDHALQEGSLDLPSIARRKQLQPAFDAFR